MILVDRRDHRCRYGSQGATEWRTVRGFLLAWGVTLPHTALLAYGTSRMVGR